MRKLLPFALLALLVSACGQSSDDGDGSSLLDMYENGEGVDSDVVVEEEEIPYSIGPSEIPDDLVIPE